MISTISGLFLIDAGYVIFSGEATDEDLGVTLFRLGGLFVGVLLLLLPLEVLVSKKISGPKLQNFTVLVNSQGDDITYSIFLTNSLHSTSLNSYSLREALVSNLIFKNLDLMSFVAPSLSEKFVM